MKYVCPLLIALFVWLSVQSTAQDTAAAVLERRAEAEHYKILTAKINNLEEAQNVILRRQQSLQDRLNSLEREIARIKEDMAKGNVNLVTREELRSVVKDLQEVDRKREADRELILKSFRDLAKLPAPAAVPARTEPSPTPDGPSYDHLVERGQTLSIIAQTYNREKFEPEGFERITVKHLEQWNPQVVKRGVLLEGETIRIPIPPRKKR